MRVAVANASAPSLTPRLRRSGQSARYSPGLMWFDAPASSVLTRGSVIAPYHSREFPPLAMRLSLDALATLDAIARRGSFAAAAEELHRVPSAVTYTVQKLEQDLGVTLFDRTGHRARLTPAGVELLREGRHLLRAAGEIEQRVQRFAQGWESELAITVDEIIPLPRIYPLLEEFYRLNPGTRLRLGAEVLAGTWDALLSGRADLVIGVSGDPPSEGGCSILPLGVVDFVFVVAPDHPLASCTGTAAAREHPRASRRHGRRQFAQPAAADHRAALRSGLPQRAGDAGEDRRARGGTRGGLSAYTSCAPAARGRTPGGEGSGGVQAHRPDQRRLAAARVRARRSSGSCHASRTRRWWRVCWRSCSAPTLALPHQRSLVGEGTYTPSPAAAGEGVGWGKRSARGGRGSALPRERMLAGEARVGAS